MEYVKVARTDELRDGEKKKVEVGGKAVLLAKVDGAYYAIENTCPHMGGDLSAGVLVGSRVACPRHGSVFDVTTGKAVKPGKMLLINVKVRDVQRYEVRVEGEDVLVGQA